MNCTIILYHPTLPTLPILAFDYSETEELHKYRNRGWEIYRITRVNSWPDPSTYLT